MKKSDAAVHYVCSECGKKTPMPEPLRRRDGRVRTDACAQSYARQFEKNVVVALRWDDAKALAELLTELLEDGSVTLHASKGYVGERVGLIERAIMSIACANPVMPKPAKKR